MDSAEKPPGLRLAGVDTMSKAFREKDLAEVLTRIGFIFSGFILVQVAGYSSYRLALFANGVAFAAVLAAYVLALAMIFAALLVGLRLAPRAYWVLLAAAYAVVLEFAVNVALQPFYRTDSLAYTQYSASVFLQGRNPYSEDMTPALIAFRVPPDAWTPLEVGGLFGRSPYPSLSFLVYLPVLLVGGTDVRGVFLAFHLLGLSVLYLRSSPDFRAVAPLGLVMTLDLIDYTSAGVPDILWVMPALLMAFDRGSPRKAGLWYGIACSFKQTPWILAPFLVIQYWKEEGSRLGPGTRGFILVGLGTFLLLNSPFLLWDPGAWFTAMFAPFLSLQPPAGIGLSALTQYGFVSLPRTFYTLAELGVFGFLLAAFALSYPRLKHAIWILPAIILFVSYRTLQGYIVYWAPFTLCALATWWEDCDRSTGR